MASRKEGLRELQYIGNDRRDASSPLRCGAGFGAGVRERVERGEYQPGRAAQGGEGRRARRTKNGARAGTWREGPIARARTRERETDLLVRSQGRGEVGRGGGERRCRHGGGGRARARGCEGGSEGEAGRGDPQEALTPIGVR